LSYDELLDLLAVECDGFSGAALAGVARAAASRALERSVWDFAGSISSGEAVNEGGSIADCLVTQQDFEGAIEDVMESSSGGDGGDIIEAKSEEEEKEKEKSDDSTPDTSDSEITKN
jgi:SpoVK/Ycf46/Vps4 family AAA+-type ATPase